LIDQPDWGEVCSDLRIVLFIDLPIVVYILDNVNNNTKSC